jgi:cytochrome P450
VITFDPHDPRYEVDGVPFDELARIRRECPVARTPRGDWYVARREDVEAILKDVETFTADLSRFAELDGVELVPEDERFLSEIPEPRHGEVRRIFNGAFGPHRVKQIEPFVRGMVTELVDALVDAGGGDLHHGLALPIPGRTMAKLMGLPDDAPELFMAWTVDGSLMRRAATPSTLPDGPPQCPYFREQLALRKAAEHPADDLITTMLNARPGGEPMPDEEIVTQLHFMIQAGVHTTRSLLTHLLNRLVQDPALYDEMAADRSLIGRAIEESLRRDSPVQATTRRVQRDVVIAGTPVHRGDWIQVGVQSANVDEATFDDAGAFRLDRPDPRDHLGFGAGSHVCPGATLARMEATTMLDVLFDRAAEVSAVPGATYPPLPGALGHAPIPCVITPRA